MELGRYAGPFEEIPYDNYIQSPIGLVPKAENSGKTRQIFHLSYDFKNGNRSVNHHTPASKCSISYNDLDRAVKTALKLINRGGISLRFSKTDLRSAFRILPLKPECYKWLIMKATNPEDNKTYYFVEKCLPFGSSISCSHFQRFSNALKHLMLKLNGKELTGEEIDFITNYLDDFLFIALQSGTCNRMVERFLDLCSQLGVPVAEDKTEWSSIRIIFLGILLDGEKCVLSIPEDKRIRAINMLELMINKKKTTVKEIEKLAGYLNFLNRAIVPGRAFTRRMYAKFTNQKQHLRSYHHLKIDAKFKKDCEVWLKFLNNLSITTICRPFINFSVEETAEDLKFYTDAAAGKNLGYGFIYENMWTFNQWETGFIQKFEKHINIEFLKLYA